ncbi:hypothetical protein KP509_19G025400 [Ceratopteris richardii]|uniref:Reverse transcriptase zinc-binding domain-containing protein n=1 Tax=Ceratopteris richardii TaxID=49495 RepID=A0A8T2SKJ7_CERRI|nr:hypothetical protein KP509_19G025400 [Ceratopteris richardii]
MWRIFTCHFTLGAFLSRHGLRGVRCPHCASYDESMRHVFWTCSFTQRWWNKLFLFPTWDVRPSKIGSTFSLLGSGDKVLDWVRKRCISLLLWNIWMFRNKKLFQNKAMSQAFHGLYASLHCVVKSTSCLMKTEHRSLPSWRLSDSFIGHTCVCGG